MNELWSDFITVIKFCLILQVSQSGLDIVGFLIDRLASEFKPYLNTILTSVLDRLGDTRMEVREKANIVLCKLMDATVSPQQLFEKISPGFSHKNSRVREEVLLLLQNTLNAHGAGQLTVSKLIPAIVTSTSDPQAAVRDAAIQTLVEIYRYNKMEINLDHHGYWLILLSNNFNELNLHNPLL